MYQSVLVDLNSYVNQFMVIEEQGHVSLHGFGSFAFSVF